MELIRKSIRHQGRYQNWVDRETGQVIWLAWRYGSLDRRPRKFSTEEQAKDWVEKTYTVEIEYRDYISDIGKQEFLRVVWQTGVTTQTLSFVQAAAASHAVRCFQSKHCSSFRIITNVNND